MKGIFMITFKENEERLEEEVSEFEDDEPDYCD